MKTVQVKVEVGLAQPDGIVNIRVAFKNGVCIGYGLGEVEPLPEDFADLKLDRVGGLQPSSEGPKYFNPEHMISDDELRAMIKSNQFVSAVKAYRNYAGCGLKEAHDYVRG